MANRHRFCSRQRTAPLHSLISMMALSPPRLGPHLLKKIRPKAVQQLISSPEAVLDELLAHAEDPWFLRSNMLQEPIAWPITLLDSVLKFFALAFRPFESKVKHLISILKQGFQRLSVVIGKKWRESN